VASTGKNEAILTVERVKSPTPHEQAVFDRLKQLGYEPEMRGADGPVNPGKDVGLVVVCSGHAPSDLLEADLPVLVCNRAPLFGLGMVLARPQADFGTAEYSSVFIGPDAARHPLAGKRTGEVAITAGGPQGWAKPGPQAVVAATVGGDGKKAVAFGYDKGEAMPGLDAPHRRVAFLAGTADAPLNDDGWKLFDAAAGWARAGGGPSAAEGPAGHWFLQDGTPTRALAAEEYRDWVHEQVSGRVWKSLLAILSFMGIGGLVGLYLFLTAQIDGKVDERVGKKTQDVKKSLDDALKDQAAVQVAQLVFQTSPVAKEVVAQLGVKAGEALKEKLNKDDVIRKQLVDAATEGLYGEGKLADELVARFRKKAVDSPQARRLLLQLILIYGTPKQRLDLRNDLLKIIQDDDEDEAVRATSLESYQPAADPKDAAKDLRHILERLDGKPLSQPLQKAYVQFISHFPESHARELLDWLTSDKHPPGDAAKVVLAGLFQMKPADQAGPRPLELVVDLAVSREKELRDLGAEGLRQFAANPKTQVSPESRYAALEKLLNSLTPVQELDGRPAPPTSRDSPVLAGLLRPGDEDFLVKRMPPEKTPEDEPTPLAKDGATQLLLFNWAGRLEKERAKGVAGTLLDRLYRANDVLYGEGTAKVLEVAVRYGDAAGARRFWNNFANALYQGNPNPAGAAFRGQNALAAAVAKDAESSPPFALLAEFLTSLEKSKSDPKKKADIREAVKAALKANYSASPRGPADLAKLRAALESPAVLKGGELHQVFSQFLREASQTITNDLRTRFSYLRDLNAQAAQYTAVIQTDPKGASWYYLRGALYLNKMRDPGRALADLNKAIELDPEPPEYYEARGDLYRKQVATRPSAAAEYQAALTRLPNREKGKSPGSARAGLYRKLALTAVLLDDPAEVQRLAKQASTLFPNKADRAQVEEVLGLLHLKRGDAKAAFANTSAVKDALPKSAWNWVIRYLAARELNQSGDAEEAYKQWQNVGVKNDLGGFYDFLPELMDKHLGVKSREERVMKGPPARSGKNEVIHPFAMQAGKTYVIDMESFDFDAYLIVLGPSGKEVGRDDDGGGGLNARLTLRPTDSGTYQIVATSFTMGDVQGVYTLLIREAPGE
jgi:tetratricopeptide (TPR) repeat protein